MDFGEEYHKGLVSFSSDHIGGKWYQHDFSLVSLGTSLGHLAQYNFYRDLATCESYQETIQR